MKLVTRLLLCLLLIQFHPLSCDEMKKHQEQTEEIYATGKGCKESSFTGIAAPMFGWGLALTFLIGLLTGLIHQSGHAHD
ncbi:MAG: hypothetical protein L0207_05945 [Chlamydiae bacterium]|nr:hypothetical protein [Chlamydiota bacterium]